VGYTLDKWAAWEKKEAGRTRPRWDSRGKERKERKKGRVGRLGIRPERVLKFKNVF
jgi:hypothetical protein